MENTKLSAKGIKREAKGLLTDNWSRALAVMCTSLFALALFLLTIEFVNALLDTMNLMGNTYNDTASLKTLTDYYEYYAERGLQTDGIIAIVLSIFYFLFVSPLNVGIVGWYQSLAQCSQLQVGQIFYYYRSNSSFMDALRFELSRIGRCIFYGAICFTPSLFFFGAALGRMVGAKGERSAALPLGIAGAALLIVGALCYAAFILRFFVAKYLFVSEKGYNVGRCFLLSKNYMKGHVGVVLSLIISYIPALITCVLIAPAVFIIPQFQASLAAAAQDIIDINTLE